MSEPFMQGRKTDVRCRKETVRNGKIEFMRFVFAVIILLHHSRDFLGDDISPFLGGSLGVEFFFLVSGWLMMASVEKKNQMGKPDAIGKETARYIGRKWIAVLPESLISWGIAFAVMFIAKGWTISSAVLRIIDGIWEPLFVTMTGLGQRGVNSVVWYISAMLICMAVLYPLLRKYRNVTLNLIIPLTSLCIFGFFYKNYGAPRNPTLWVGWTYKGVLRAFAELGIGCWLYYASGRLSRYHYTRLGRWIISITECLLYLIVIYYMYRVGAKKYDYFFIALMAAAVALSFSGAGIDAKLFNNKAVMWLGRFSVPLYFSHKFWSLTLNYFVPAAWPIQYRMASYVALAVVTAWVVMVMANAVRKKGPGIYRKMMRLIVKEKSE